MKFRRFPIATAVSAALGLGTSAALAQEQLIEEVVVTASPIKDSQAAALNAKRLADNNVDIVAADTIGQFPDQNLADSLSRLPGMAIERDQGQARYINMRGAPFRWTTIAFDGIDVPGAENGRVPRFDSFPSVITSRLEANKAILPSMPGESVSGYINIHSFSPFDKDGLSFASDFATGEQQLGNDDIEKQALRVSWSNQNFGAMIFGSKNNRKQITDNREYDLEHSDSGELIVNELDFRSYKVEREDNSYGGTLEYRGEGMLQRAYVNHLYAEFQDHEQRNQFVFGAVEPQEGVSAENVDFTVRRMLEKGLYKNYTKTSTAGIDLHIGEWFVEPRYNHTKTENSMHLPIPMSSGGLVTGNYDLSDIKDPKLYLNNDLADVEYASTLGLIYGSELKIDADKYKIDANRDFEWFDLTSTVSLGAQWDSRKAKGFVTSPVYGAFPGEVDIDDFNTGERWDSNTTNTIGGTYYNNNGLLHAWKNYDSVSLAGRVSDNAKIAIDEDVLSLYAMVRTEFSWGNIVGGLRMEHTDYSSKGTIEDQTVSYNENFTNYLPSLHVNVDLTDDLKWRTSYTTGINRPNYDEWRVAASVSVTDETVSGGNPTLKEEKAWGFDSVLEWYFAPASILSAGAFYRHLDDVIYTDVSTIDGGVYFAPAAGEEWTFNGAVNGKTGEMKGMEFNAIALAENWLPSPFDGLGISANLTLLDSEFETLEGRKLDLPGTSDTIYNASLFYEKYDLSVRLNYQFRDKWISPLEDPEEKWDEQKRLDLSIVYTLPMDYQGIMFSVYANANNLTDETDVRFGANGLINQSESYGRRYLVGVRVNY